MRCADRLFQLVQLIRGRRITTAAFLANRLEVSKRTVYRDVADLQHQGVPIEGEPGIGYRLGKGFELPPLMFTRQEASALMVSARLAQSWVDPAMARHIGSALGKILSLLPAEARTAAEAQLLFAPSLPADDAVRSRLQVLREAAEARHKLHLDYCDVHGASTARTVRPLGCFYWGKVWTLAAWCELRAEFRGFRVDRMAEINLLPDRFQDEPAKSLAEMLRRLGAHREKGPGDAY